MAILNFGGVQENVITRDEFPLEKARDVLKDEVIAVIGYGVQGPGQAQNLRDNGFNVIVGQRQPSPTWDEGPFPAIQLRLLIPRSAATGGSRVPGPGTFPLS